MVFDKVYNYFDYLALVEKVIHQTEIIIDARKATKEREVVKHVADTVHIPYLRLYELLARRNKPSHRELQSLISNQSLLKIYKTF